MKQLTLVGGCAHLNTTSNNYLSSRAVRCLDCGSSYVHVVCRNNIDHTPTPI